MEDMCGWPGKGAVGGPLWLIASLEDASDVPRKVDIILRNLLLDGGGCDTVGATVLRYISALVL